MLEDASIRKCVHNQPVDDHAIHNHGVDLRGCINTLDLARWTWPEMGVENGHRVKGSALKVTMEKLLHRSPVCEFLDVVRYVRRETIVKEKTKPITVCITCGGVGCRKRKGHEKEKRDVLHRSEVERDVKDEYPLESIVPGHERWELLVEYAGEDAIAALEIEELCRLEPDPAPWPYTYPSGGPGSEDDRPTFNQGVVDEVVLMERTGFNVDTVYAGDRLKLAETDELNELVWLRRWLLKNVPVEDVPEFALVTGIGDGRAVYDEEIDAIWSSNQKLAAVFDYFGFPRSPVWKKGKVKRDEVKLDGAALEWIKKNHPPSAQVIGRILQLKKIRSQMKYLEKLANCGGYVNPICGPAGDGDSRNGAVTGRLGIKGVLEAQQLPTREEVDLYQVRRAIVA